MRRHKRSITFSFIIPDSAFKFRTQMLREHIFPETDAAPHTHTSSSSVDGSKVWPCEVSQGSHANSDMLTFPGNGSDKLKIEINFLKGLNLIKTTKPEQDLGFSPLQDSPTMVMLQFKVIMRNPNKSKFSMVAESHRPGLLEAQEACVLQECLKKNQCFFFFFSTSDFKVSTKLWKERCAPTPGRSGLLSPHWDVLPRLGGQLSCLHTEMLGPMLLANETLLTTVGPRSRSRPSVWLFLPSQDIPVL